jgi:hypothetical protein
MDKIASICNFTYKLKLVEDGFHGAFVNGKWNGMVGELIDKVFSKQNLIIMLSFNYLYCYCYYYQRKLISQQLL